MTLTEDSHRRFNILSREWVLVSPHRTARPWQGEISSVSGAAEPRYDPNCYLCPGNSRVGGIRNPKYSSTFVFDNDFAALQPQSSHQGFDFDNRGLLVAESESGTCRVMCFSPRHDLTLATMEVEDIAIVVKTWIEQFRELGERQDINHVQIFENRGAMMGASNPHPHCQIWGTASIPEMPARELASQRDYAASHSQCLLCDYLELELQQRTRLTAENDDFVPSLIPWDFISPRPMAPSIPSGTSTCTSIHRCCVRRPFENLWSDSRCSELRSAISPQRSRRKEYAVWAAASELWA